jgi:hypothetical protein
LNHLKIVILQCSDYFLTYQLNFGLENEGAARYSSFFYLRLIMRNSTDSNPILWDQDTIHLCPQVCKNEKATYNNSVERLVPIEDLMKEKPKKIFRYYCTIQSVYFAVDEPNFSNSSITGWIFAFTDFPNSVSVPSAL